MLQALVWQFERAVSAWCPHMKSSMLSWRPAGMSDAKGPIWDSVSQHWKNNCEGLEKCLYKECTMLVHQKVKEKKSVSMQHVFFIDIWLITMVGSS